MRSCCGIVNRHVNIAKKKNKFIFQQFFFGMQIVNTDME